MLSEDVEMIPCEEKYNILRCQKCNSELTVLYEKCMKCSEKKEEFVTDEGITKMGILRFCNNYYNLHQGNISHIDIRSNEKYTIQNYVSEAKSVFNKIFEKSIRVKIDYIVFYLIEGKRLLFTQEHINDFFL